MILQLSLFLILILLILLIRWRLKKFNKPLYEFQGEYSYNYVGQKNEYLTETAKFASLDGNSSVVILFFSGNPGSVRFYDRFLSYISQLIEQKHEVIGIGQAGSCKIEGEYEQYFSLDQQIDHKIKYFQYLCNQNKYTNSKFILIGHSFGCYAALKLINQVDASNIVHVLMIHPVIDRIMETPNGKHRYSLVKYNVFFKVLIKSIDCCFSVSLKRWLAHKIFQYEQHQGGEDIFDCVESLIQWIDYHTLQSFLHLACYQFFEMGHIVEKEIYDFSQKITVYYAKNDGWTPENQRIEFKQKYGEHVEIYEDEIGVEHTFVAGGSRLIAELIHKKLMILI